MSSCFSSSLHNKKQIGLDDLIGAGWCSDPLQKLNHYEYRLYNQCALVSCHYADEPEQSSPKTSAMFDEWNAQACCQCGSTTSLTGTPTNLEVSDPRSFFYPKKHLPPPHFRQTFRQWKAAQDMMFRIRQMRKKRKIFLHPMEELPDFLINLQFTSSSPKTGFIELLAEFLRYYFFGFDVDIIPFISDATSRWKITERYHSKTNTRQLCVRDIHQQLRTILPSNGFAILAVCWTDLYPSDEFNFVLGEALQQSNTAAFCFGRFEPIAYKEGEDLNDISLMDGNLLWKMLRVVSHETCHIFGLNHCYFFQCAMNESSSIQEALSQPLFLCPVCLRKLQKACQFDVMTRYRSLEAFLCKIATQFPSRELNLSVVWLRQVMAYITGMPMTADLTEDIIECTRL